MVIIFQNYKARKQLVHNGEVFTFRTKPHKLGKDWITDMRCGKKICDVEVVQCFKINNSDELKPFVNASGFETLTQWIDAIYLLHKYKIHETIEGYVWFVTRVLK